MVLVEWRHLDALISNLPSLAHVVDLVLAAKFATTIPWSGLKELLCRLLVWLSEEARGDTARA